MATILLSNAFDMTTNTAFRGADWGHDDEYIDCRDGFRVDVATPGSDMFGGSDVIRGNGGNDHLSGGLGTDADMGGLAPDVLLYAVDQDQFRGGAQADALSVGVRFDLLGADDFQFI